MKAIDEMFSLMMVPLVYGSSGINLDFVKHQQAEMDADIVVEAFADLFVYSAPATILETSATTTGLAQTITITGPVIGDVNVVSPIQLVGLDIAVQLNDFTLVKTDMKFEIRFLNAAAVVLSPRTQVVEGTASVENGNTRQFMRFMCFEQNVTISSTNVSSIQDGKQISFPTFRSPDPVNLAAFLVAVPLTTAQLATIFPSLHEDIAAINVVLPAGGWTAGVGISIMAITAGRLDTVAQMMKSLDLYGLANSSPGELKSGGKSLFQKFTGL